jgi:DNA processing protein
MSAIDLTALSFLPVRRWLAVADQLRAGQPPQAILEQQCAEAGLTPEALRTQAARAHALAADARLDAVLWSDRDYPARLGAIVDPPAVVWIRGQRAALARRAVAIVGSRAASPYALAVAEGLAADLATHGIAVVSGLARGVDSAAHRGALSVGGITIGVLGCGADIMYPPEHAALAREMIVDGAVVSELAPGTPPLPMFFPQRNRVISGLSQAVVIVEAGEKSGSLITARCALEQGRDVLAVPGNVLSGRNRGGHALLRDGAKIVETAADILEELGVREPPPGDPASNGEDAVPLDPVLAALIPGESCDLDDLAERSGLAPERLLPRLFELELQGQVRRAGGGRFVRFDRAC